MRLPRRCRAGGSPFGRGLPACCAIAQVALGLLVGGCQPLPPKAPPPGTRLTYDQLVRVPLEKNITSISVYYDPYNPWIRNDDRSKIIGLVLNALYLRGPDSLGAFGDGVIRPRLYVLEMVDGKETPKLAKEWSFDVDQAMGWRSKARTVQGWGYGPRLLWKDELDLHGKQIRVTISFERTDGMVIHSREKDFPVPP